jgi:hypothetical protein
MKREVVEILLRCYRKGRDKREDARIVKAVRLAKKDQDLKKRLERQTDFDASVAKAIAEIAPPRNLQNKLVAAACGELGDGGWKFSFRHPAILAVLSGMLIIGVFLIYLMMKQLDDFSGRDTILGLIERVDSMSGDELEAVDAQANDLVDWMAMHGLEDFRIPAVFASRRIIGRRTFTQDGAPVVQLVVENAEDTDSRVVILMLFRARDFGIDTAELEEWRIVSSEGWVSGVRAEDGECVAVTFLGAEGDMEEFLDELRE